MTLNGLWRLIEKCRRVASSKNIPYWYVSCSGLFAKNTSVAFSTTASVIGRNTTIQASNQRGAPRWNAFAARCGLASCNATDWADLQPKTIALQQLRELISDCIRP